MPKNPDSCDDTVGQRFIPLVDANFTAHVQHLWCSEFTGYERELPFLKKKHKHLMGNSAIILFSLKEIHMLLLVIHCT